MAATRKVLISNAAKEIQALLAQLEKQVATFEEFERVGQIALTKAAQQMRPIVNAILIANYHKHLKSQTGNYLEAIEGFTIRAGKSGVLIEMKPGMTKKEKTKSGEVVTVPGNFYAQAGFYRKYRDVFDIPESEYPKLTEIVVRAYQVELNEVLKKK